MAARKTTPKAQAKAVKNSASARKPVNPKETARRAKPIAQVKGKPGRSR